MHIYFIRHAQSSNNALWNNSGGSYGRVEDPELTDLGWRQAEKVAEFIQSQQENFQFDQDDIQNLKGMGITHIYSSLMTRAVSTAHCIAEKIDMPVKGWVDIHECGGIFLDDEASGMRKGLPGKTGADLAGRFPRLVLPDELGDGGWWSRPYENLDLWIGRAQKVVERLIRIHGDSDDRIVMVSHGCFFRYFLCALLNLDSENGAWFDMNNVAISRLEINGYTKRVYYLNRVDFLPKELIT
jgi:2,3-bisphosphoglycerate-dependent phosphoglycerate mutase